MVEGFGAGTLKAEPNASQFRTQLLTGKFGLL